MTSKIIKMFSWRIFSSIFLVLVFSGDSTRAQGPAVPSPTPFEDKYLWLESSENPATIKWVQDQNAKTLKILTAESHYNELIPQIRAILTASDRIPIPALRNGKIRNFWQDENHVRGIWRETTPDDFENANPKWETLLDIDALNKQEGKSWVYEGAECLPPRYARCLLKLSDGGRDEVVVREFDASKKKFAAEGYEVPAAKTEISWVDNDNVLIGTDFGSGSLTTSGYPRLVKLWKRGTPLASAKTVFEGKVTDVSVNGWKNFRDEASNIYVQESPSFFESITYLYGSNGALTKIPFPDTSEFQGDFQGYTLARLRQDWQTPAKTFPAGSLVSLPIKKIADPHALKYLEAVFEPDGRSAFSQLATSKYFFFLTILRNVKSELYEIARNPKGGWTLKKIGLPSDGVIDVVATSNFEDKFYATYETFTVPPTLYLGEGKKISQPLRKEKELSPKYNADGIVFDQFEVASRDGTKIPYFVIHKKDFKHDGLNPTILYAYGGFEISETPYYLGTIGKIWLEKGGVYVIANIRGGGEFGPKWHEAALKENRQRAYDDFFAVTRDLFDREITNSSHLGIQGGSNGGLLMGVALTQHPEYYMAVVCESALLDMLRYTKLPPGASWIGEYGDPDDPNMNAVISKYSPYQNTKPGVKYPEAFFHISTADDRVQPGHTRKMVARLQELGADVLMYENTEGGHGGAADLEQRVKKAALEFTYFYRQLML